MLKTITQGTIEQCRDFIAEQQEYIRSLVSENEKLREYVLDKAINQRSFNLVHSPLTNDVK